MLQHDAAAMRSYGHAEVGTPRREGCLEAATHRDWDTQRVGTPGGQEHPEGRDNWRQEDLEAETPMGQGHPEGRDTQRKGHLETGRLGGGDCSGRDTQRAKMPRGKDTQRQGHLEAGMPGGRLTPETGSTGGVMFQWISFWFPSRGGLASALQEKNRKQHKHLFAFLHLCRSHHG